MNVVVCVKQIPDPAEPGKLEADNTLDRSGKLILDESDSYGVEMALQLADAAGGGEVTLVSMAPNGETAGLRTALAMGAAKAILVSDDALSGAGALECDLPDGVTLEHDRVESAFDRCERMVSVDERRVDAHVQPPVDERRRPDEADGHAHLSGSGEAALRSTRLLDLPSHRT